MKLSGENNPFFGRKHAEETRQKMRESHADVSGNKHPCFGRTGDKHPMWGKKHSKEKMRNLKLGKKNPQSIEA